MSYLLLLSLVYLSVSFTDQCCMPQQMEADQESFQLIHTNISKEENANVISYLSAHIWYDVTNHRQASRAITNTNFKEYYTYQFFENHTIYTYQEEDQSCSLIQLPPMIPTEICIPPLATKKPGKCSSVGAPNTETYDTYVVNFGGITAEYLVDEQCITVEQKNSGEINGVRTEMMARMFNITLGIHDASVFELPSACYNVTETKTGLLVTCCEMHLGASLKISQ